MPRPAVKSARSRCHPRFDGYRKRPLSPATSTRGGELAKASSYRFGGRFSTDRPEDSFVTVRYKELWFWIDNDDYQSKRTLSIMQLMFSLAESGGGQVQPVVTVQAGG